MASLSRRNMLKVGAAGLVAVTATDVSDGVEVQVLPAFRYGDGYRVPDPQGTGWIQTFPKRFAHQLTRVNQRLSGNVVPVIKLAKEMCAAKGVDVKSYHLENMALRAFQHYTGPTTLPAMLRHYFQQARNLCQQPIRDLSGQSTYVDEGLAIISRQALAQRFGAVERDVESAMASTSLDPWQGLFEK